MNPNDSSVLIAVALIVVFVALGIGALCARADNREDRPVTWNGKFVVLPGPVISLSDGQEHYVTSNELIRLYGVNPRDCFVLTALQYSRFRLHNGRGFVVLAPRHDGDYNIISAFADANVMLPAEERIDVFA